MKIQLIGNGLDVRSLQWALKKTENWDKNTTRTADNTSPHFGLSDIWARYAAPHESGDLPHDSIWYPGADDIGVKPLVNQVMSIVGGTKLGGVLITRIPAGHECKPHVDNGWHAQHYEKFAVQVESSPGQMFCFDGESLETKPGDLFWFNNSHRHWVTNPTPYERVTLIACIRRE